MTAAIVLITSHLWRHYLAASGAVTIANGAVETAMVNANVIGGRQLLLQVLTQLMIQFYCMMQTQVHLKKYHLLIYPLVLVD